MKDLAVLAVYIFLPCTSSLLEEELWLISVDPCGVRLCHHLCDIYTDCDTPHYHSTHLTCHISSHIAHGEVNVGANKTHLDQKGLRAVATRLHGWKHVSDQLLPTRHQALFKRVIMKGRLNLVKCIVLNDLVDLEVKWENGETPVMLAAMSGQPHVFDYLVSQGCNPMVRSLKDQSVLHAASIGGSVPIVKKLVESGRYESDLKQQTGDTPILLAAKNGNLDVFKYLETHRCYLYAVDNVCGRNALHVACLYGQENMVSYLVKIFAIESKDRVSSRTPLLWASRFNNVKVADRLIAEGCDLQARDSQGDPAIHLALLAIPYTLELLKKLIDVHDISIETPGSGGCTPVIQAARQENVKAIQFLASRGCNMFSVCKNGYNALHVASLNGKWRSVRLLIESYHIDVDVRTNTGLTPLLLVAGKGELIKARMLVKLGANVLSEDNFGSTALHEASSNRDESMVKYILKVSHGKIPIDSTDNYEKTPLMIAARYGRYAVFRHLVSQGASLDETDNVMNTVFHYACKGDAVKIVKFMIKHGKANKSRNVNYERPIDVARHYVKQLLLRI